jgi:hypothetical protein
LKEYTDLDEKLFYAVTVKVDKSNRLREKPSSLVRT